MDSAQPHPPQTPSDADTTKLIQTLKQFVNELYTTFPEFSEHLQKWMNLDELDPMWIEQMIPHILEMYPPHFFDIMFKSDTLFDNTAAKILYFLPGLDFNSLMHVDNITPELQNTIWDYLHAILFLVIPLVKDKTQFRDAAHLFDSVPDEELSERIFDAFKNCNPLMDETEKGTPDQESSENTEERAAHSAEKMKGLLERIMGSKLGRLSKNLMDELRPEIESMFPDINLHEESTQSDVFKLLMKNPTKMILLIKKAKERMESKIKSGEITRDELMEDMAEMMKDGDLKTEMEAMMKHMGGKGKMNPNAMRSEMAKHAQRNRMRQKREQKQQRDFFTAQASAPDAYFRVDNDQEGRQTTKRPQTEAEIAAIIAELEETVKPPSLKLKKKGKKRE